MVPAGDTTAGRGAFRPLFSLLALGQGTYYLAAGLWPLIHMPSFLRLTGPKRDLWLVHTAGAVVAAGGSALAVAGLRRHATVEVAVLGAGSALALGTADAVYVRRGTIPAVFLLDAAAETLFVLAWAVLTLLSRRR